MDRFIKVQGPTCFLLIACFIFHLTSLGGVQTESQEAHFILVCDGWFINYLIYWYEGA